MMNSEKLRPDVLGLKGQLEEALEDPALEAFDRGSPPAGSEAAAAAYRLASVLGYCRLFGVQLGDDLDGALPPSEAVGAAEELRRWLERWTTEARSLPARWDNAFPQEADALCADLLEARMDAWAAFVAISEAHEEAVASPEPPCVELDAALERLFDAMDQFDAALRDEEILSLLATLVELPLLENWRKLLAPPYSELLPWWLDGTLEDMAEQYSAESSHESRDRPEETLARPRTSASAGLAYRDTLLSLQPLATAADTPTAVPRFVSVGTWTSPDERYRAVLDAPASPSPQQPIPLRFFTADSQPAIEMAGLKVRLAGLEGRVDEGGRVLFLLQDVQKSVQAGTPYELLVGEAQTSWAACSEQS